MNVQLVQLAALADEHPELFASPAFTSIHDQLGGLRLQVASLERALAVDSPDPSALRPYIAGATNLLARLAGQAGALATLRPRASQNGSPS